jgi:hypothetical protein
VQVDLINPKLKALGSRRLKQGYDRPLSSFAVKFNLRRYSEVSESIPVPRRGGLIVGPGGVNIRRLKEESCADIQVDRATETAICT